MATYTVTLNIQTDGVTLTGFPIIKTLTTPEDGGRQVFNRASMAGFVDLPLAELGDVNLLLVDTDQDITLRLNDQSDAGIPIKGNGLFLIVNSNIPGSATSKGSAENQSGNSAQLTQVAGGT